MRERPNSTNELEGPITEVPVDMPQRTMLVRCPHCRHAIDAQKLSENLDVCPRCGQHMRIGARRRIGITIDQGSLKEWDADFTTEDILHFPDYPEKLKVARERSGGEREGVVTGEATIVGERCALFVMNGDFMMGSMGAVVGEKITRCFERATKEKLPVVGFTVSGGARMQEGLTSLMQMAKVSDAVREHSEAGLLYIAVLTDPTSGGVTASFAMEADITLAEPNALVAFAGPRIVEQTTHKRLPQGFQRSEFQLKHGFVDAIIERKDLPLTLGYLLYLHDGEALNSDKEAPKCSAAFPDEPRWPAPRHLQAPLKEGASAYDKVKRVRANDRPSIPTIVEQVFQGFFELHGDREFGDDPAIVGGIGLLEGKPVEVICTDRGRGIRERLERNYGSPEPEGYRKALRLMKQAEKFHRPVVYLIDTSGAYPGMEAEERGQGAAIADNLVAMGDLKTPELSVIMGEGGSGGALGLAVTNKVLMLSDAVYSVVSPEGCSSILWKTPKRADEAAEALGITADFLQHIGIVDGVIDATGLGTPEFADTFRARIERELSDLESMDSDQLIEQRHDKFRAIGRNRQ